MNQGSCGYHCFLYLCKILSITHRINQEILLEMKQKHQHSFADFQTIIEHSNGIANAYECRQDVPTPCIASMKNYNYEHYVVILRYGLMVQYYEPNRGIYYLPRSIFNYFFTKYVFVVDCF